MRRGEVRWYRFKHPDKKRPVVILTRSSAITYLHAVTVAPVTTTIRHIPSEVYLTKTDGLAKTCVISCDNIQTIAKQHLGSQIASLSPSKINELDIAVNFALGFG